MTAETGAMCTDPRCPKLHTLATQCEVPSTDAAVPLLHDLEQQRRAAEPVVPPTAAEVMGGIAPWCRESDCRIEHRVDTPHDRRATSGPTLEQLQMAERTRRDVDDLVAARFPGLDKDTDEPAPGVWVYAYMGDHGYTPISIHATELDALRALNNGIDGKVLPVPFGVEVDDVLNARA